MITKKCNFLTKDIILGTNPAVGYETLVNKYIADEVDKNMLTYAQQKVKKGEKVEDKVVEILSIFHRDEKGNPVLGSWMLRKCLTNTAGFIFNAKKNKDHPARAVMETAVGRVTPNLLTLKNGSLVKHADGVFSKAVTTKDAKGAPRSFFKAYEYLSAGIKFKADIEFDEELISEKCIDFLLSKIGRIGAYRERFGLFVLI